MAKIKAKVVRVKPGGPGTGRKLHPGSLHHILPRLSQPKREHMMMSTPNQYPDTMRARMLADRFRSMHPASATTGNHAVKAHVRKGKLVKSYRRK